MKLIEFINFIISSSKKCFQVINTGSNFSSLSGAIFSKRKRECSFCSVIDFKSVKKKRTTCAPLQQTWTQIYGGQTRNCNIPAEHSADDFVDELYVPGSLVWAKSKGFPWWPAMVEDDPDREEYHVKGESNEEDEYHVVFISKKVSRGWIPLGKVKSYLKPPPDNTKHLKPAANMSSESEEEIEVVFEKIRSAFLSTSRPAKRRHVSGRTSADAPPPEALDIWQNEGRKVQSPALNPIYSPTDINFDDDDGSQAASCPSLNLSNTAAWVEGLSSLQSGCSSQHPDFEPYSFSPTTVSISVRIQHEKTTQCSRNSFLMQLPNTSAHSSQGPASTVPRPISAAQSSRNVCSVQLPSAAAQSRGYVFAAQQTQSSREDIPAQPASAQSSGYVFAAQQTQSSRENIPAQPPSAQFSGYVFSAQQAQSSQDIFAVQPPSATAQSSGYVFAAQQTQSSREDLPAQPPSAAAQSSQEGISVQLSTATPQSRDSLPVKRLKNWSVESWKLKIGKWTIQTERLGPIVIDWDIAAMYVQYQRNEFPRLPRKLRQVFNTVDLTQAENTLPERILLHS